jgi:D-arabinose 5-phosphate isomerase GutQ
MKDSVMLQNIWEQPQVVADCLALDLNLPSWLHGTSTKRLVLLACGSSRHAALVAQEWFESLAKIPTRVLDAAAWTDRAPLLEPQTVIIAISQSGKTKDVLDALDHIKAAHPEGINVLSIANIADSPLVQRADASLVTPAGVEGAVAATKSFTAQLAVLARLVLDLADRSHANFFEKPSRGGRLGSGLDGGGVGGDFGPGIDAADRPRRRAETEGNLLRSCGRLWCRGFLSRSNGHFETGVSGDCAAVGVSAV